MPETLATTKMSSRGQVVIPESVRNSLGLKAGSRFVVIGQEDMVLLKVLLPPSPEEFAALQKRLRRKASAVGRTQKDIPGAIASVRRSS